MRARLPWTPAPSDEHPTIEPLEAGDARRLRLPWLSRFSTSTVEDQLAQHPGHSLWVPATGEYAIVAPWRNRSDIAQAVEIVGRRGKEALIDAVVNKARNRGYQLLLLSDDVWSEDSRLYIELGFRQLERIVFFNRELRHLDLTQSANDFPLLTFTRADLGQLDILVRLDHASFPWLWWNSLAEFETYLQMPDVHVYVAFDDQTPVGYSSFTMYNKWAHLDRLAVIVEQQGRGFGAAQLQYLLGVMQSMSADSVNLSTQEDNLRSHRLYRSFGFQQSTEKMGFYGLDL